VTQARKARGQTGPPARGLVNSKAEYTNWYKMLSGLEKRLKELTKMQERLDRLLKYWETDFLLDVTMAMFNHLNFHFENARQLSVAERTFLSNRGRVRHVYDGGVLFEDVDGGVRNLYLALLEAKKNKSSLPSFAESEEKLRKVQEIINDRGRISPKIDSALRTAIEHQRQFAVCKVILFYAANDMDGPTKSACMMNKISVVSPNSNVKTAPDMSGARYHFLVGDELLISSFQSRGGEAALGAPPQPLAGQRRALRRAGAPAAAAAAAQ
jgi:hypothetical protein